MAESVEVLIVGAGPIGLELAVSLQAMGVGYVQLEAGLIGQTVLDYPPGTTFFSSPERIAIAGVPLMLADQCKATREHYLTYLHAVVKQFGLRVRDGERVVSIAKRGDGRFAVASSQGAYDARVVVLAIGDMHHPRELSVPGEGLPHVSHHLREPLRYFGRRVLIVGGKNSAVEAALRCQRAGARVTISYRGDAFDEGSIKYWLLPEIKALIKHGQVGYHPRTVPTQIDATAVTLASVDDPSQTHTAAADDVLLLTGYEQDKTLFESAGVELEGGNLAPRHDPTTMMSNVENLYLAGTAAAGTQHAFKLYIENSHPHVTRIITSITGSAPPDHLVNTAAKTYGLPES
ncbi:MAG: NAD(P)-binding domain-containing protein [Phycisphaerales bacterium JB063]